MPGTFTGTVLAIDASAPRSAVAVGRIDGAKSTLAFGEDRVDGANQASQTLDHRIVHALEGASVDVAGLDALACGRGPGTFTGTRVAVATMQGLSLGTQCPVFGVGTLEALAHTVEAAQAGEWIMPLLDARRGEVYGQLFEAVSGERGDVHLTARTEPSCQPLASLLQSFAALQSDGHAPRLRAVGPGVAPYATQLADATDEARPNEGPTAASLWAAVCAAARRGDTPRPAHELSALYLRATYAELGLNKPKRPVFKSPLI